MYPPNVLEAKAKEASDDTRSALIFGCIGLICFGFIFGFLAFRKANNALEIIDLYQVVPEKRSMAMGAKILGIADIVLWGVGLILRIYLS